MFKTMKTESSNEEEFPNVDIVRTFLISAPEGRGWSSLKG